MESLAFQMGSLSVLGLPTPRRALTQDEQRLSPQLRVPLNHSKSHRLVDNRRRYRLTIDDSNQPPKLAYVLRNENKQATRQVVWSSTHRGADAIGRHGPRKSPTKAWEGVRITDPPPAPIDPMDWPSLGTKMPRRRSDTKTPTGRGGRQEPEPAHFSEPLRQAATLAYQPRLWTMLQNLSPQEQYSPSSFSTVSYGEYQTEGTSVWDDDGQSLGDSDIDDEALCNTLRGMALERGKLMATRFSKSQRAYRADDKERAKLLSNEGHEHRAEMEKLNKMASSIIYRKYNPEIKFDEIDLHEQFVGEAISLTDEAIATARQVGESELRIIVGRGLHSEGFDAKLRPAVEEHISLLGLQSRFDYQNDGVLIVELDREKGRYGFSPKSSSDGYSGSSDGYRGLYW